MNYNMVLHQILKLFVKFYKKYIFFVGLPKVLMSRSHWLFNSSISFHQPTFCFSKITNNNSQFSFLFIIIIRIRIIIIKLEI